MTFVHIMIVQRGGCDKYTFENTNYYLCSVYPAVKWFLIVLPRLLYVTSYINQYSPSSFLLSVSLFAICCGAIVQSNSGNHNV